MPLKETVMERLTEEIFRRIYGKSSSVLYDNKFSKLREDIRNAVIKLRQSYRPQENSKCEVFYYDEDCRKAYMLAYYPYFIIPVGNVLKSCVFPKLDYDKKIYLDYFACGPCPELLGTALALNSYSSDANKKVQLNVWTYDFEEEWSPYLKITEELCNKIFKTKVTFIPKFDIEKSNSYLSLLRNSSLENTLKDRLKNKTNIIFMQNYLSHISESEDSVKNFVDWLGNLAALVQKGTFFVLTDLNYDATREVFEKICAFPFLIKNSLVLINRHIPSDGEPIKVDHGIFSVSRGIRENIFAPNIEYLKEPKRYTNYYFVVLQKK